MLFSQYLLDKQLLSPEQVLAIMLEQITSVPSVPEIIDEHSLLPKKDLLDILFRQQIHNKDFLTSSYELGLMKQEILEKIMAKVAVKQKSFTEIALEKGYITSEILSKEAVNYSELLTNKKINSQNTENKAVISDNSNNSLKPLNGVNKSMLVEYLNCFEQSVKPCLITLIEKYRNNEVAEDKNYAEIKKVQAEFVTAKAAANFINAKISENISSDCGKFLENLMNKKIKIDKENLLNFLTIALEILTNLYNSLKKDGKEQDSENSLQDKIKLLYSIIGQNL
ncbi:hypothetical protein ACWNT8_07285 [Pigmentibacter ruber]|uniref:hypothetical protein n=1 Tax=Pigmentibacter ruber TaxID=2683196 RepID=UPI00131CF9C2|nr:hypothetical protein [Pigmentibacter ruber]BFD32929.1 hypothetical protein GTC16762_25470 [Pigmentibacter ruber]